MQTLLHLNGLKQRLFITGDESRGVFTLQIRSVQKTDEGRYSCCNANMGYVLDTAGSAERTVLVPPSSLSPRCSVLNPQWIITS